MVSAAILNTALGGGAAGLSKGLYLDGTNVLTQQGGVAGSAFGAPIGSIVHTEVGPPGISSLQWTLDDPAKVIIPARGMRVVLHDHVLDRPLFYGWLQRWKATPVGLGRQWSMSAMGAEVLLDWAIVPSLAWAAGDQANDTVMRAAAAALWPPGVSVRYATGVLSAGSSLNFPVSTFTYNFGSQTVQMAVAGSVTAKTLRETIGAIFAASHVTGFDEWAGVAVNGPFIGVSTIDPYLGLRCYGKTDAVQDYDDLTVTDTAAGALVAMGLEHEAEAGSIPSGVFVQGAGAGTGPVVAGDGIPGPMRVISDSNITTDAARKAAANALLTDQGNLPERGSLTISDHTISTNVHPGSRLILTDAETGATGTYVISQLVRTFTATRQTWQVSYGSLPPSLPRVVRYLTRGTLS